MRRHLIEQQEGCGAFEARDQARMGEHERNQQRLLFTRRAMLGRTAAGLEADHEIAPLRAIAGLGLGVAAAHGREVPPVALLGLERGRIAEPALDQPVKRQGRLWKRRLRLDDCTFEPPDQVEPRGRDRDRPLRHVVLDRSQPGLIETALGEQLGARAPAALEGKRATGMGRIERENQTIKKAPPPRRALDEQPIHRRRQPDQRNMLGERRLPAREPAIDAHHAPLATGLGATGERPAGGKLDAAMLGRDARADGPGGRHRLDIGAIAQRIRKMGATQAPPRAQERDGFEKIGLARAIRPGEHDRFRPEG